MNASSQMTWSATALALGWDLAVKSTAILVIVLVIQHVLARRRALLGSAIGNAGLIGLLLLPLSAILFPSVPVACLPREASAPRSSAMSDFISPSTIASPRDFAEEPMSTTQAREHAAYASGSTAKLVRRAIAVPSVPPAPRTIADAPPAGSRQNWRIDWAAIAIVGYIIATLVSLARISTSLRDVARLKRSFAKVDDTAWTEPLGRWRRKLGIGRDVALAWSPRLSVPVVVGWLRPAIVLPSSLLGAHGLKHADAVLLHELAHVRRADYFWNLVLRLVQAVYWPHILVWVLARTIAEMRERACDDLCVHEMGGPPAYRETLLAVASGMLRRPSPALGMAMAQPSKLGRRLARIDRTKGDDRCLPRWPVRLAIVAMAITATWMIGAIQLVQTEARTTSLDGPPKTTKAADPAPPSGKAGRVFHLQVVAADTGKPVPDADVRVWISFNDFWRKTDAQGHLDVTHSTGPSDRNFTIDVWGEGRAMQRHNWGIAPNKPIPDRETIKLEPGESLGGLVRDEAARPIAGATIYLWSHNYKKKDPHEILYELRAITGADGKWQTSGAPETTGELLGVQIIHPDFLSSRNFGDKEIIPKIADVRASRAVTVMKKGVPIEGRVVDADGRPVAGARVLSSSDKGFLFSSISCDSVSTDANGHFRTGQVKAGEWFLVATAKGHAPGDQRVKIKTAVPQVEIKLGRPRSFKGRVVDPDGRPIAGAFVNPDTWRGYRFLGTFLWSDADGRFRWDDAPNDELLVNVSEQGYAGLSMQSVSPTVEEVVFTLKPSLSISGNLRDAETKKRVDDATIEIGAVDPKTGEPSKWTSKPENGSGIGVYQGRLSLNFPVTADAYKIRVKSPGFEPFVSRTFRREEKVVSDYEIVLIPGNKPAGALGTALRPDGKPLAGARVYSTQGRENLSVQDGVVNGRTPGNREDRTGPEGTFPLPQDEERWIVLILGDDHYAIASKEAIEKSAKVVAKPYARVEGRYLIGSRPVPNQAVELGGHIQNRSTMLCTIFLGQKATTDQEGRFTFKNVIPTNDLHVSRRSRDVGPGRIFTLGEPVRVEPGASAQVTFGGKGRPVIGRVEPPQGWTKPVDFTDNSEAYIESDRPWTPYPLSLFRGKTTLNGPDGSEWSSRWLESPEGRDYRDRRVAVRVGLATDGSFRLDDVPSDDYRLAVRVNSMNRRDPGPFARIVQTFTVGPIPGGRSDEPLDLGVLQLRPLVTVKAGDPAPTFDVTTIQGNKLSVPGDFKGKVVLLDFSTLWDSQHAFQITRLNDVNQKFGKDPRFAILSLCLAPDGPETRKYIEDKGETWPQAIVGPLSNPISHAYGINDENVPATLLIGPDGKVIASNLWYNQIGEAVGKALGPIEK